MQVRHRQIWHKPRPAAGLGKRTGGAVLEGAMSVGGLGWRPATHRRGRAERASCGEVNLGRRHGRGRAERAGREEADLGWRTGGAVGLGLGRWERPPVAWWHADENEKRGGGVVLCVGLGLGFFLFFYFLYNAFAIHRAKRS